MSLFGRCPHCGEYRNLRVDRDPFYPKEVVDEPCDGCDEADAKLTWIARNDEEAA